MTRWSVALAVSLTLGGALAGCLGGDDEVDDPLGSLSGLVPVEARHLQPYIVGKEWSYALVNGTLAVLPPLDVFIDVALPQTELGATLLAPGEGPMVHMGVWLPDVPAGTKVPVIADVGPYYEDGDVAATDPANRLGRFLIENFVPYGYAVAQVSVFGTGQSNHCMDLMGMSEQLGIDAAVTWLGEQAWSNGNVGLIGRSYDGSTPWEAATFGNPALKTIVPISGLIGMHELMWRNGTAESRGPVMHNQVYGFFGIDSFRASTNNPTSSSVNDPDAGDLQTLCPDYATGLVEGFGAYVTGDYLAYGPNDYWTERSFLARTLANYDGSIYFIHGLQDWNVDNHMAFPTYQTLVDSGYEIKALFGQWAHMYPDRYSEHKNLPEGRGAEAVPTSVRFDWAQDLLEWFDHYLMETGPKPQLHVEVQDNLGGWRIEPTYPPQDVSWLKIPMSDMTAEHTTPDVLVGAPDANGDAQTRLRYILPTFTNDTRVAGNVRFHVTVTPLGPGGQIFARLEDAETGMHYAHAVMDLRYAAGGEEMGVQMAGMPMVAKMEFWAMDVVIPAGTTLALELSVDGEDYRQPAVNDPVLIDTSDASVLKLPVQTPPMERFFAPPEFVPPAADE